MFVSSLPNRNQSIFFKNPKKGECVMMPHDIFFIYYFHLFNFNFSHTEFFQIFLNLFPFYSDPTISILFV